MVRKRASSNKENTSRSRPQRNHQPKPEPAVKGTHDQAEVLIRLQQTLGNQAVNRMLVGNTDGDSPPTLVIRSPSIQRDDDDPKTVQQVIDKGDSDYVDDLTNLQLRGATQKQRFDLIQLVLSNTWVGPNDEKVIERIWSSFSKRDLAKAYGSSRGQGIWKASIRYGAELDDIEKIKEIKRDFERDVVSTAKHYLDANEAHVLQQMKAIGRVPGMCVAPTEEHDRNLEALQAAAAKVVGAQKALKGLRTLPVGYNTRPDYEITERPGGGWRSERLADVTETAYFNPDRAPNTPPKGDESPPMASWSQTKFHFESLKGVISGFANTYPAIYAMLRDGDIEKFSKAESPEKAQGMVGEAMDSLYTKIIDVRSKLGGDLDYRDLKPIHAQLFRGTKAPQGSGIDWSQDLNKWAAEDLISDYESSEFWTSLILGGIAAVAFIVAELATAGTATFFIAAGVGIGSSALSAGISWEKYLDLAQAAESNVKDDLALVSQAQATAALISAVLDSAFMFLDIYGVGKVFKAGVPVIKEAAEAGLKKATVAGLKGLGKMSAEEAAPIASRSIAELGVEETVRRSGKSADELMAIVGKESETGERLSTYLKTAKGEFRVGTDMWAVQLIEKHGPMQALAMAGGWKKLASTLGDGSKAGDYLMAWREKLYKDLKEYARKELGGNLERTGSRGNFTNDLDISLLGPDAAANRDRVRSWLAGRSGTSPNKLGKLLNADFFTDPRRMHLLDELPDAARKKVAKLAAGFERDLIWNQRLYQAIKSGDDSLVVEIRDQMKALGIKETKFAPLDKLDIHALNKEIDSLHKKFFELSPGESAAREKLAREIAEKQALINAAEGGGYFSGGGVRKFASEREGLPGFTKAELADEARKMLPEQKLTALLDQMPKLDEAASKLLNAKSPDQLADALKDIGKYGERLAKMAEDLAPGGIAGSATFEELAKTFGDLLAAARKSVKEATPLAGSVVKRADTNVQKAFSALNNLERSTVDIMILLRRRAGMEDAAASMLAKIQLMTKAHVKFLRAKDAAYLQAKEVARLVHNSTKGTSTDSK